MTIVKDGTVAKMKKNSISMDQVVLIIIGMI